MNRLLVCLFFLRAATVHAEHHYFRYARRAVTAAYCAASAVDGWQSATYVNGTTVRERNSLLRAQAGVNIPLMIGVKAATCGAVFTVTELAGRTVFEKPLTAGAGSLAFTQIRTDILNARRIR